jgi:hypothetical protein
MAPEPKPKPPVEGIAKWWADITGEQGTGGFFRDWANNSSSVDRDRLNFAQSLGNFLVSNPQAAAGKGAGDIQYAKDLVENAKAWGQQYKNPQAGPAGATGTTTAGQSGIQRAGSILARERGMPVTPVDPNAVDPNALQGGGGYGMGSIYDPLFAGINSQRKLVNERYKANQGNIVNLYGQITAARQKDINSTNQLYSGLQAAAAGRATDINAQLDTREATRLQQQQELMQSLGLSGMPSPANDNAAREAAQQRAMTMATNENWTGYLGAQQANAQGALRGDINAAQFQRGADLQNLRNNRAGAMDQLFQQEQGIKSQRAQAQAQLAAAQTSAAASLQKAMIEAQTQVQKAQIAAASKNFTAQGPVMTGISLGVQNGVITPEESSAITNTISDIYRAYKPSDFGATTWSPSIMMQALTKDETYTGQLSLAQQQVLMGIIQNLKY